MKFIPHNTISEYYLVDGGGAATDTENPVAVLVQGSEDAPNGGANGSLLPNGSEAAAGCLLGEVVLVTKS